MMKLNEVITENRFTDFAKRQAFNLVGQHSDWGRQGLELHKKKNFITKVEQLLSMNIKSANVAGNTPDPSYVKNLVVGYLKKNGVNIPLLPPPDPNAPAPATPPNVPYWEEQIDKLSPGVASNNSKAINQMANLIYQIISSESESQPTATLGGTDAGTTTPAPAPDKDVNAIVSMIRKLATQGNTTGLQTIANAVNRSLSRIAKQQAAQQPAQPTTTTTPASPAANPTQAQIQQAYQNAGLIPETKKSVKSWIKDE
jgi:hypothetical protein